MNQDWTSLPQADAVTRLENDPRPAWLWPADGKPAIWSNAAAGLFGAKLKSSGLKRAEPPAPVKGQIARILRLGLMGRAMPSRMQFMAGRKPLSATCLCTPLDLGGDTPWLLMVGVDPIDAEMLAAARAEGLDAPVAEIEDKAPIAEIEDGAPVAVEAESEDVEAEMRSGLAALVDKLAQHEQLFDPLGEEDDAPLPAGNEAGKSVPGRDFAAIAFDEEIEANGEKHASDWGDDDPLAGDEASFAADTNEDQAPARAGLWQVTGRGLTIPRAVYTEDEPAENEDAIEQASRYNFEELSRILTDRVGREEPAEDTPAAPERAGGALVPLSEEALVLNRLPIGILIFRDQEIVFANRALVDLTGYQNATALRALGLAAIFPTVDAQEPAGPVTHLVRRDGERVAVSARLNSVTWQGRPGFMLTARANDIEPLREAEVQDFAALWARVSGFDFLAADRAGLLIAYTPAEANGKTPVMGAPLDALIPASEQSALRQFLSLSARFAGGVRPAIALKGRQKGQTLTLFAEGRAGIITGYFGLLGDGVQHKSGARGTLPAALLGRITRGLRRPLNTISGFSELMTAEAFGPMGNPRYLEYARDIRAAGFEIGDIADELDQYIRLAEGELALSPADIDIGALLAECLVRVRAQAGRQRVLLRSAISERLPLVRVDEATLRQAILNMLASAISEAGEGAKVVLSAQVDEDGAVSVHVRDAAKAPNALAERFVVFRDGVAADGTARAPSQSSIGLTLTRSLVAVNACSFSLDPASDTGTLMTLTIPASLVVKS